MGLFKKFFSIGSRKSKKSPGNPCTESLPPAQEYLKPCDDGDAEAAVSRLLRSSSGRFLSDSRIGLDALPPLPHPIDSVIPRPKSSSTTIASVSARSTYSVVIRSRTVHSRTEFPNAYPPMDTTFTPKRSLTDPRRRSKSVPITPRDKNRLMLLRQDPSVASLLNHYDNEGHLNSALFSNTPSPYKDGHVQRRRTGSTLRQLLGQPSSRALRNSTEGDISWAEKFLGETDANSSVSSIGPETPVDTHFTHIHSFDDKTTLHIECDTSSTNHQTFSSLDVEPSASADHPHSQALDSPNGNCITPQRASQIFGFLGDKKRAHDGSVSKLPQLKTTIPNYRRFSAESSISDTKQSQISLPRRSDTHTFQPTSPINHRRLSLAPDTNKSPSPTDAVYFAPQPKDVAFSSPLAVPPQHSGQNGRGSRGSCVPSKIPSRQSTGPMPVPWAIDKTHPVTERPVPMQSVLNEKLNAEGGVLGVSPSREMHSQIPKLRTTSGCSSSSSQSKHDPVIHCSRQHPIALRPGIQQKSRSIGAEHLMCFTPHGKENDVLSRLPQPVTPIRPFALHSAHLHEPPSPASSSELSPVAKQMMASLRQQRMNARQQERQAGRLGSSESKIRY